MTKILVIDTETGGVDPLTHSLLSVAAVVWDDGVAAGEIAVDVLEDPLVVTPRAMDINRIDLVAHARNALSPEHAASALKEFVELHFADELASGERAVLAGHNLAFDVGFLGRLARLSGVAVDDLFSHRTIDTAGILRFLKLAGLLPLKGAGSNEGFAYFGIDIPEADRHTAIGDARATTALLSCLVSVGRQVGRGRNAA